MILMLELEECVSCGKPPDHAAGWAVLVVKLAEGDLRPSPHNTYCLECVRRLLGVSELVVEVKGGRR